MSNFFKALYKKPGNNRSEIFALLGGTTEEGERGKAKKDAYPS